MGGFSSGGWLSYMLGLARGGVIRGISAAAGGLRPGSRAVRRAPKQPIAALLLDGRGRHDEPRDGADRIRRRARSRPVDQSVARARRHERIGTTCARLRPREVRRPPEPRSSVIRCGPPGQGPQRYGGGAFKTGESGPSESIVALALLRQISRCQIDRRSSHTPTQAPDRDGVDGDGVDGVQELDGVHGDLRSEAKCVQELDGVHGGPRSEAKCPGAIGTGEASKARRLAAVSIRHGLAAASPHSYVTTGSMADR